MLFHLFFHQNWPITLENYSAISRRHPSDTNPLLTWKIPVLVCFQRGLFYYLADLTHLILPEFQYLRDSAFNLSVMISQCPRSWILPDLGSLTGWCNWNCSTQKKAVRNKAGEMQPLLSLLLSGGGILKTVLSADGKVQTHEGGGPIFFLFAPQHVPSETTTFPRL